jgi:flagellar motor switch protein FliM
MLDKACSSEMTIKVEGVPKYLGVPGIHHGNKAIQISNFSAKGGNGE